MTSSRMLGDVSSPAYFRTIQVLRGVAALLVVIYHLVDAERIYGHGTNLLDGVARLGFSGVDVFFVISGFVMITISRSASGPRSGAATFLGRRAARILPMYWLFTSVIVLMMIAAPHSVDPSFFQKSRLASYLLWPQADFPLLQVGWTLSYEAFFYLVTAAVLALRWNTHFGTVLAAWALCILGLQAMSPTHPWQAVVASPLTWEFIAGGFIALYWSALPERLALPVLVAGATCFVGGACVLDALDRVQQYPITRTLVFGMPTALIVLGLVRREAAGRINPSRWARAVGDASYSLYLSHLFVITALSRLWGRTRLSGSIIGHAAFVTVAVCAATAAALICYRFVERPTFRYLEGLFRARDAGERSSALTGAMSG